MPRFLFFLFFLFLTFCGSDVYAKQEKITISAASSLQESLTKILKDNPTTRVISLNSSASGTLARQILVGAKIHLFISANFEWVEFLRKKKLLDEKNTSYFVSNRLALAKNCEKKTQSLQDASRIALGDFEYVPVGIYAKNYLKQSALWDSLQAKFIFTISETQAVQYAKRGLVDLAFIYYTSVFFEKKLCLVQFIESAKSGDIAYQITIVAKNKDPEVVEIYRYLKSDRVLKTLQNYGFVFNVFTTK